MGGAALGKGGSVTTTKWLTTERCPVCLAQGMWFAPWSKTLRCDSCNHVVDEVRDARQEDMQRRPRS